MEPLPAEFRLIRLRLAREPGHPAGDTLHGYDLVAPLDAEGRLLPDVWKKHRDACRVRKLHPRGDEIGVLARRPGGSWYFDYDNADDTEDETGFRFGEEHFRIGEYISIREDDGVMHTFQVTAVERP